jgi:hypothetical protein
MKHFTPARSHRPAHDTSGNANLQDTSSSGYDDSASAAYDGSPDIGDFFNFTSLNSSPFSPASPSNGSPPVPPADSGSGGPGQLTLLGDDGSLSPVQSNSGAGSSSSSASHATVAPPPPTLVGASGGLQFDLIWDASVASAPAAFETAAIKAATLYASMFSNREVINIHVGYGEVAGYSLGSGALAASMSYGYMENYATVASALKQDAASSSYQKTADANLPSTDPTKGGTFFVSTAEAKALGQVSGNGSGIDGYVGLSSAYSFDYNSPTTPVGRTQYDAIGALEHEFSEVMGRMGSVGSIFGHNVYTPLDMFRYSSSGVHDLTAGPGYFSIDNGKTNLGTYNNPKNGGDAADWIPTLVGDSYGSGYNGVAAAVSATDLIEESVLGYKMTPLALAATKTPGLA